MSDTPVLDRATGLAVIERLAEARELLVDLDAEIASNRATGAATHPLLERFADYVERLAKDVGGNLPEGLAELEGVLTLYLAELDQPAAASPENDNDTTDDNDDSGDDDGLPAVRFCPECRGFLSVAEAGNELLLCELCGGMFDEATLAAIATPPWSNAS